MSTIIIYASKYGTVEKCTLSLKDLLKDKVSIYPVADIKKQKKDLASYDTIILGCSVHAGQIQGKMKKLIKKQLPLLMKKRVGLFLCSLTPPEKAAAYFHKNFPEQLVQHTHARGLFGGELIYEKMNPLEQFILKKISKSDENKDLINHENIKQFAELMNKA